MGYQVGSMWGVGGMGAQPCRHAGPGGWCMALVDLLGWDGRGLGGFGLPCRALDGVAWHGMAWRNIALYFLVFNWIALD